FGINETDRWIVDLVQGCLHDVPSFLDWHGPAPLFSPNDGRPRPVLSKSQQVPCIQILLVLIAKNPDRAVTMSVSIQSGSGQPFLVRFPDVFCNHRSGHNVIVGTVGPIEVYENVKEILSDIALSLLAQ